MWYRARTIFLTVLRNFVPYFSVPYPILYFLETLPTLLTLRGVV